MTIARLLTPAAIAVVLAGHAGAQSMVDASGTSLGDNISTVHRIDDEHALIWTVTEFDPLAATDPSSPFGGLGGPCFGQVEIRGTAASGGGYCTWTDGDGDTSVLRWTATAVDDSGAVETVNVSTRAGAGKGEWTAVGGTGKWQGATGGGTYRDEEELETGRRVFTLAGEVALR